MFGLMRVSTHKSIVKSMNEEHSTYLSCLLSEIHVYERVITFISQTYPKIGIKQVVRKAMAYQRKHKKPIPDTVLKKIDYRCPEPVESVEFAQSALETGGDTL